MKSRLTFIFPILLIIVAILIPGAPARSLEGMEYQIKAAMMINFIQFVDWPDAAGQAEEFLTIGIFGEDKFGDTLNSIEGRIVSGRRLKLRRLNTIHELKQCQIVFIPESESHRTNEILKFLNGAPVLTIGESDQFTRMGGIIRFYLDRNHVRFEINKTAASHSKLKLSAKLMEVARVVD
jgi:hypothetical protein